MNYKAGAQSDSESFFSSLLVFLDLQRAVPRSICATIKEARLVISSHNNKTKKIAFWNASNKSTWNYSIDPPISEAPHCQVQSQLRGGVSFLATPPSQPSNREYFLIFIINSIIIKSVGMSFKRREDRLCGPHMQYYSLFSTEG